MLQEIIQIINATNWTVIVMIMSFMTIINFFKYDDPNPKAHFEFKKIEIEHTRRIHSVFQIPQLVLTYKLYGGG